MNDPLLWHVYIFWTGQLQLCVLHCWGVLFKRGGHSFGNGFDLQSILYTLLIFQCSLHSCFVCHRSSVVCDHCQLKRVETARSGLRPLCRIILWPPACRISHQQESMNCFPVESFQHNSLKKVLAFIFIVGHSDVKWFLVNIMHQANELFSYA